MSSVTAVDPMVKPKSAESVGEAPLAAPEVDANAVKLIAGNETKANDHGERRSSMLALRTGNVVPLTSANTVVRMSPSAAAYDVSPDNPNALANLAKAIEGNISRDDLTQLDPESGKTVKLSDILPVADKQGDEIVVFHRDTQGRSGLGRTLRSAGYWSTRPHLAVGQKLGIISDPEKVYGMWIKNLLSQLDREGVFGEAGQSTFNPDDWNVTTRTMWRDVVITKKK